MVSLAYSKGDKVVAVRDIGGVMRELVPKGSRGVVIAAGWLGPTKVQFRVTGLMGERTVELEVQNDEIG